MINIYVFEIFQNAIEDWLHVPLGEISRTVYENAAVARSVVQEIEEVSLTINEMTVFSLAKQGKLEEAKTLKSKMQITLQRNLDYEKKQRDDLKKEITAKNFFIEQEAEKLKNRVNNFDSSGK